MLDVNELLKNLSSFLIFVFTSKLGLLSLLAVLLVSLFIRLYRDPHAASLAERAAGSHLRPLEAFLCIIDSTGRILARFLVSLPTLFILALSLSAFIAAGSALARIEEAANAAQRIQELRTLVKNLDRSIKVADIRVLSSDERGTRLSLDYFDPSGKQGAGESQVLSIRGTDIYFDSIVLNFEYSELSDGKQVNIAIPYRIFSDEIAQNEGIALGAFDAEGIPYAFHRSDEDIYGLSPAIYHQRLTELMALIHTDESARSAGIVRSLYGSAVHKKVSAGDRLEVRIEQTGGLTVKEKFSF
ncbi:hypothetical protein MASR2M78_32800 [Treponema sp.]